MSVDNLLCILVTPVDSTWLSHAISTGLTYAWDAPSPPAWHGTAGATVDCNHIMALFGYAFFSITGGEMWQSEKNCVKQIDFFTLPPAAAWYVRRVLHCDARIMERGRNLNFCHLASNVLNRAAKTNTAHVYCHDSFINEMTRLKRGSFEEKNLASNC
jgi:hypothetical protein